MKKTFSIDERRREEIKKKLKVITNAAGGLVKIMNSFPRHSHRVTRKLEPDNDQKISIEYQDCMPTVKATYDEENFRYEIRVKELYKFKEDKK